MMVVAMFLAGGFSLATAAAPGWPALLALRFLTGVALAGVPAVAMAYVSEEVDHASVGSAMGLYIGGSAIGGMAGRLGVSLLTDIAGWRGAVALVGVAGIAMAEAFRRTVDWRLLGWMMPGAILGIVLGYLFAARLSESAVLGAVGAISLLFGIYRLWADRNGPPQVAKGLPEWLGTLFGIASGFTSQIAHAP